MAQNWFQMVNMGVNEQLDLCSMSKSGPTVSKPDFFDRLLYIPSLIDIVSYIRHLLYVFSGNLLRFYNILLLLFQKIFACGAYLLQKLSNFIANAL